MVDGEVFRQIAEIIFLNQSEEVVIIWLSIWWFALESNWTCEYSIVVWFQIAHVHLSAMNKWKTKENTLVINLKNNPAICIWFYGIDKKTHTKHAFQFQF